MKTLLASLILAAVSMHQVAALDVLPTRATVISDSEAGYDQAAYDACMDSSDEAVCE